MAQSQRPRTAYKEMTLQQLRGFCETIRLGSFSAAAQALGLSHPTIWSQVHALERRFGTKLVDTGASGCRATEDGQLLADLAAPLVAGFGSLEGVFCEAQVGAVQRLVIAATPRILIEDLTESVVQFGDRAPRVQVTLRELRAAEVVAAVRSGEADLGFSSSFDTDPGDAWAQFEPSYELDVVLVTPNDHPLARRRVVRPKDLRGYPLVNAPGSLIDPAVSVALEKLGIFQSQPRRVEASYAETIRRYVEAGFGIGLIGRVPSHPPHSRLHERSMSRYFGRTTVYLVRRRGVLEASHVREFAATVAEVLNRP